MDNHGVSEIRKALGLTPEGLAAELGVHRTTVTRWENGTWGVPRAHALALEALKGRAKPRRVAERAA